MNLTVCSAVNGERGSLMIRKNAVCFILLRTFRNSGN